MEYCFLKGFLVVLLTQQCTSEDLATSIQSPMAVTLPDGLTAPRAPELPRAEVVPAVAPPSLREVQQAVQEASEQVESRGAEEVLKELLERVVGAALGQVEGGSEARAVEGALREVVEEEEEEEEEDARAGPERTAEKGSEGEDSEEQEVAEVEAFEPIAEEGKGTTEEEEGETAAESTGESTAGAGTGGREAGGVEVINESPDTGVSQVAEEAGLEKAGVGEDRGAAETETQDTEGTPGIVEAAVGGETQEEAVEESDPNPAAPDAEQLAGALEKGDAPEDKTRAAELGSEGTANFETDTAQSVAGEEEEEEEEVVKVTEGQDAGVEHVAEGGAAEEGEGIAGADEGGQAAGGEKAGEIKEESVALVNEEGGEEGVTSATSRGNATEGPETPVISGPEPEEAAEASVKHVARNRAPTPTPSPALGGSERGENALGEDKSDRDNEIIAPTDDLSAEIPAAEQPTLDNVAKGVPAGEGGEPGKANELGQEATGSAEVSEPGLEAWKIGAISAAALLVAETTVVIIYVLKCRSRSNTPAAQRACEEGRVEPEAATGGECSDDTLPAGNGDAQQIAALDPSDVASTLAQNKERREEAHATAMSDLAPGSRPESANTGPGPDSSQDLRTSIL